MSKYLIHLVSHTHWDREWYLPFEVMRLRLVDMMNRLLNILETNPAFKFFTLDGQTVILEDYLEIRPDTEGKLKKYIKEGKILVGPWYTLPDEFLVSGEALIRNLLTGMRIAKKFGRVMKTGYLPDMFGHISQLPQILLGFDIPIAILWRGIEKLKAEYILQGPDGSKVFLFRLNPKSGYSNGLHILESIEEFNNFRQKEISRSGSHHLLFMYGGDHRFPDSNLPKLIEKISLSLEDADLIQSDLEVYTKSVRKEMKSLETIGGEQREGLRYAPILPGVLSSRVYLKQRNEEMQILLERWVEPFSTINLLFGGKCKRDIVRKAWKYLLQNHAHDSICGCSLDDVHLDMERRFSWVEEIGKRTLSESLGGIVQNIDIPENSVVVLNPLNWERGGRVDVTIEFANGEEFILTDGDDEIPYEIMDREVVDKERTKTKISFYASSIPSVGYKTYFIKKGKGSFSNQIESGDRWAENENLRMEIEKNGTLTLLDKKTNEIYKGLAYFEDSGDNGDEYNYSPTPDNASLDTVGTEAQIKKEQNSPCVRFKVKKIFRIPNGLTRRKTRSKKMVNLEIASLITLLPSSRRVEIETLVINKAKNHRLRVMFPTGVKTMSFFTFSKFDCIERKVKDLPSSENWVEKPTGNFPFDNFIDVHSGKRGLAVLSNETKEGEIVKSSVVALTLLRCVGDLSRDDLVTRRGHAGYPIPTPGAQCHGKYRFKYAILPHAGNWKEAGVLRESLEHSVDLKTVFNDQPQHGYLPKEFSFLSISPPELVLSSFKLAEDSDFLVLRVYNPTKEKKEGKVRLFKPVKQVYLSNLNEEKKKPIQVKDGIITIIVKGKKIVTLLLSMRG